jgi:hypothetical protein
LRGACAIAGATLGDEAAIGLAVDDDRRRVDVWVCLLYHDSILLGLFPDFCDRVCLIPHAVFFCLLDKVKLV